MPEPACKPCRYPAAFVVALALHLLALASALRLGVWPDRTQRIGRAPLTVQLVWPQAMAPQAAAVVEPPRSVVNSLRPSQRAPSDRRVATPLPSPPGPASLAITLPAAPAMPTAPAEPVATAASAAALNLILPRSASAAWRQRSQALDDPRSNTPRLTLEQKLAMAMGGDGTWVEEMIDADHRRMRRGNLCVYLQRPAAAQLDPFHPANRNLPWQAGRPTRCD